MGKELYYNKEKNILSCKDTPTLKYITVIFRQMIHKELLTHKYIKKQRNLIFMNINQDCKEDIKEKINIEEVKNIEDVNNIEEKKNIEKKKNIIKKDLMLYIHIPFCEKKCDYCDFLSAPADRGVKNEYVNKLIQEIKSHHDLKEEYKITSIFIGGGTPSCLEVNQVNRIMEAVKDTFTFDQLGLYSKDIEITIEVNPGTVNSEKLLEYKAAGINRLSFGLQSADNQELKQLGRIHTYETFLRNYELAREVGFTNINVDLMSALPGQSVNGWLKTLEKIVDLNPEHISAYSLIVEEGTPFFSRFGEDYNNEENDRLIYTKTKEVLNERGYTRYEISNYAKDNYECRHNVGYWRRKNYLGLGLGASSLLNGIRKRNEDNLNRYLEMSSDSKLLILESEHLTGKNEMEEFMFLGLRLTKGISKESFQKEFGCPIEEVYGEELIRSKKEDLIHIGKDKIFLTEKGIDLSNMVMARFLLD